MSDATMKMPEPIIDPTTIIVPSNRPIARTNPGSLAALADETAWVVSATLQFLIIHTPSLITLLDARVVRGFKHF